MSSYRLSPQAEQTLENIIGWIIDHFGVDQAIKYKDQLITRLDSLSVSEMPHSRSCNVLLAGKRDANDLEYYREGRHYIIYRKMMDGIVVLDFVHGSRNLEAVLAGMGQHEN